MQITFRSWLRRRRGAAMAEKLFVILFAIMLVGGAVMVFGPLLAEKFEFVRVALGGGSRTPTLADPVAVETTSRAFTYVLFAMGATAFFAFFLMPLLFPRARNARQRVLVELAERWPILTPLINPDALADENMEELREIAREAKRREAHLENALEIASADFGLQADPLDATVNRDGLELDVGIVDPDATVSAVPRAPLASALMHGNDEIPFDAVSPADKPQMAPLQPRRPSAPAFPQIGGADDAATISVAEPGSSDGFVARVLRESGAFPLVNSADSGETTAIREQPSDWSTTQPEAPTVLRDALPQPSAKAGDDTLQTGRRRPTDPDATTGHGWDVPK